MVHTTEESNRLYNRSRLVQELAKGRHHSSVDQSMLTNLWLQGSIPNKTSVLFQFILELWWEKDENKEKEVGICKFKK